MADLNTDISVIVLNMNCLSIKNQGFSDGQFSSKYIHIDFIFERLICFTVVYSEVHFEVF